ncbi:MAG: hypothetical protein ABIT20_00455 [Gemmatimonadaceae bacterium]
MYYSKRSASLAIAAAIASGIVLLACRDLTEPRAVATTAVRDGIPAAGPIVISTTSLNGWALYNDQSSVPCTDPTVCSLVDGPVGTPIGSGSAELAAPTSADGNALILQSYRGVRFDHITQLHYSTYRQSADNGDNLGIALQFTVDYDLADHFDGYQGRLVFEPYQGNSGNVLQGVWQNWDAMAGKWWGTRATVSKAGLQVPNPCVQATPCTWSNLLAVFPDLGVHATYGAVVLKAGSGWTGFRGNVDGLAIGVDGQTTTFDFERVASSVLFPLTVLASPELTGNSLPEDSLYAAGATVSYVFHGPNDGRALRVYLDSIVVPNSGSIVMNGEHAIVAFLEDTTPLTGRDLSLYTTLRSLVTAPDPVSAFQASLDSMASFRMQNVEQDERPSLDERIDVIQERAFDWVRDSADLVRIDHALGGHVFHVTLPTFSDEIRIPLGSGQTRNRIPSRSTSSAEPPRAPTADATTVLYVNGVGNTPAQAIATLTKLETSLRRRRPFVSPADVTIDYVYNESIASYTSPSISQTAKCIRAVRPTNETYKSLVKWSACLHLPFRKALLIADFWEAFQQLHQLNNMGQVLNDPDVQILAGEIRYHQTAGKNVVVVPHSQGNLITNGALNYLASSGSLKLLGRPGCLAVAPLASMINNYSPVGSQYIKPVLLAGDAILNVPGGSFFPVTANNLNDSLTQERAQMPLGPKRLWRALTDAGKIHSMDSYLHEEGGKNLVVSAITEAYRACAIASVDVQPQTPFDSLLVGTSVGFTQTALNGAGDTSTKAPLWFTYGEGVSASSTGVATAISPVYSGAIVARIGATEGMYFVPTWGPGPIVQSASCTKGAVTEYYATRTTRYNFVGSASVAGGPTNRITAYRFELQMRRSNSADIWAPAVGGTLTQNGNAATAYVDVTLTLPYEGGEPLGGQWQPNGHCRVVVYDVYQRPSLPYTMAF